jgi:hypothetical protein
MELLHRPGSTEACSTDGEPQFISQGCGTDRNTAHNPAKIASAPTGCRMTWLRLMSAHVRSATDPLRGTTRVLANVPLKPPRR